MDALEIYLRGSDENGGDVTLAELRAYCEAVEQCLQLLESNTPGGRDPKGYRVSDLRHGSCRLAIEPARGAKNGSAIVKLSRTVHELARGPVVPHGVSSAALRCMRRLAPNKSHLRAIRIAGVDITGEFRENINRVLGSSMRSVGSAKGLAERLNLHNRREFTLFPSIGPKVQCRFPDRLTTAVVAAMGQSVTVHGVMRCIAGSYFPEHAAVTELIVHPSDADLPKLSDLWGSMGTPPLCIHPPSRPGDTP